VGGGVSCRNTSSLKILNTIIWANSPDGIFADPGLVTDITYSDIQESWSGEGNINSNPFFLNVANNDYHLLSNSPCLGTGNMTSNVPDRDMENNVRPNPVGSNPDMGAYESPLPIIFSTITSVDRSRTGLKSHLAAAVSRSLPQLISTPQNWSLGSTFPQMLRLERVTSSSPILTIRLPPGVICLRWLLPKLLS
jgi:hypothetical protein